MIRVGRMDNIARIGLIARTEQPAFTVWGTRITIYEGMHMKKYVLTLLGVISVAGVASGSASVVGKREAALAGVMNAQLPRVDGEFLVTVRGRIEDSQAIRDLVARGGRVLKQFRSSPTVLVRMPGSEGTLAFQTAVEGLLSAADVKNVEANAILTTKVVPNDEKFSDLYALQNSGQTGGREGADVNATAAWDVTTGSRNVLVGIIDTGIDYTHPDLKENYWSNPGETGLDENGEDRATNGRDDDGNGYIDDYQGWDFVNNDNNPMDDQGHGTHCAGTIGAQGNNGIGVAGVNWEVSMVGLKFLGSGGSGSLDDAVEAIEYATALGVNLTSNSWGGGGYSQTMAAAIAEAASKGILFVAAAGNELNNNDSIPSYPASYPIENVISVAATDHRDELAYFSNYGKNTVHLAAPGVDILSTTPGGRYRKLSGTSMACPHVSGAAALVWSAFPELDYQGVKARLMNNVSSVANLQGRTIAAGRLSLPTALENDTIAPAIVSDLTVAEAGLFDARVTWSPTGDDQTEGRARSYELRYLPQSEVGTKSWEEAEILAVVLDKDGAEQLTVNLTDLPDEFKGMIAVRAADNVGNLGDFSDPISIELADRLVVASFDATNTDGVTFEGTWGVQDVEGRGVVFSDSPNRRYETGIDISLFLPAISGDFSKTTFLVLTSSYELEARYDFGFVEVRAPGGDWVEAIKVNGSSPVTKSVVPLPEVLAGESELEIRFRIVSDVSINLDGWLIDGVSLIQAP